MKLPTLLALVISSLALTSCGEVYEATYRGTGTLERSCDPRASAGSYVFAIRVKVTDGLSARIIDMRPNVSGSTSMTSESLTNVIMNASFTGGKNDFSASGIPAYSESITESGDIQDAYDLRGSLSTDRSRLTLDYKFASKVLHGNGQSCVTQMNGEFLKDQ